MRNDVMIIRLEAKYLYRLPGDPLICDTNLEYGS
jgi:hypothetical protein